VRTWTFFGVLVPELLAQAASAAATQSNNPRARTQIGRIVFMSGNLRKAWRMFVLRHALAVPSDLGPIVSPARVREAAPHHQPRCPVTASIARGLIIVSVACLFASMAQGKEKPPENWDGLEIRKVKGLDLVYVRPNTEFPAYKSVQLEQVGVEFAKGWEKNSRDFDRRPTAEDMQEIREKLGALVQETFKQELVKHGYTVVDAPSEDTLLVRTAIIDLYINAPDVDSAVNVRTYTTSAGSMTLVLEARDGPTGQLQARVIDGRTDNSSGRMTWTNRATNTTEARRIIEVWAKRLRESLDRLNGKDK
jgi:hypothetical protein